MYIVYVGMWYTCTALLDFVVFIVDFLCCFTLECALQMFDVYPNLKYKPVYVGPFGWLKLP